MGGELAVGSADKSGVCDLRRMAADRLSMPKVSWSEEIVRFPAGHLVAGCYLDEDDSCDS